MQIKNFLFFVLFSLLSLAPCKPLNVSRFLPCHRVSHSECFFWVEMTACFWDKKEFIIHIEINPRLLSMAQPALSDLPLSEMPSSPLTLCAPSYALSQFSEYFFIPLKSCCCGRDSQPEYTSLFQHLCYSPSHSFRCRCLGSLWATCPLPFPASYWLSLLNDVPGFWPSTHHTVSYTLCDLSSSFP